MAQNQLEGSKLKKTPHYYKSPAEIRKFIIEAHSVLEYSWNNNAMTLLHQNRYYYVTDTHHSKNEKR